MTRTTIAFAVSVLITVVNSLVLAPSAAAATGCDQLGGNIQSGRICHAHAQETAYTVDIRYDTDYPDEQPVTDYLLKARDALINDAKASDGENIPWLMTVTSDTFRSGQPIRSMPEYGQPWHGTISLVIRNFRGDNRSARTTHKTFTFNYDKNQPITFDTLFAPGTNPIDKIYPAVATEMERQQYFRHYHMSPEIGRNPALYQNFAITDDAVIFFFDTSELMTEEAGWFFAAVPRPQLPPLQI